MKLLLDTHVLLWWLNGTSLSEKAFKVIEDSKNIIFVSAATAWEISIKKALGKLQAPDDLEEAIFANGFQALSIAISHATLAEQLPFYHEDPFDRLLVALAKIEKLILITRDKNQILYDIQTLVA